MRIESAVSPPDSGDVLYVSISEGPERGVHKTTDCAATWRFLQGSQSYFSDLLTVNPKRQSEIYCGSWSTSGSPDTWPMRTRDAGEHWEEIPATLNRLIPSPWIPELLFGVETHFYRYWLHRSSDDGETWELFTGSALSYMSDNVLFHSEDTLTVFAGMYVVDGPGLGRSTDGGITWEIVLEGEVPAFDQDPLDDSHWAAVDVWEGFGAEQAAFAESWDNGETWEMWELPDSIRHADQIVFDPYESGTIYLVDPLVSGYPGIRHLGVYRSTDGGQSWEPMNQGFADGTVIHWIVPLAGKPGVLVGAGNDGFWMWSDESSGERAQPKKSEHLRLEQVTPNPFGNALRGLVVGSANRDVRGSIYTVDGRLVKRLRLTGGEDAIASFSWDGKNARGREVSPGLYVVTVTDGVGSTSARAAKVR